jgi:hypothetical protein
MSPFKRTTTLALSLSLLAVSYPHSPAGAQPNPPEGFVALFDGSSLEGWFGRGTKDPRELWEMSPEDLAAHWEETMEDVKKHWTVEDGVLVNDGHGLYLTTRKDYADFELILEYKTVEKADSGIYLRGVPQVQIWDSTEEEKFKLGADKGSGGLWNNPAGSPGRDPLKKMDRPFGEWNEMRIRMVGERVDVWLNGDLVVDWAVMHNYFDKEKPIFPKGPIQLQTHGGEISWRNVFIREISPDDANTILREKVGEDFSSLFNGENLEGWVGALDNYEVVDGAIVCKQGKGGNLMSPEEYGDFHLIFEFKTPPAGNNGIAVRAPVEGDPAWQGLEIQVLGENYPSPLKDYQYHGSVYGVVPAHRGFLRDFEDWNYQEIIMVGQEIEVILNGTTILKSDLSSIDRSALERVPAGLDRASGHIGLAGHNDPVAFRHLYIKPLD